MTEDNILDLDNLNNYFKIFKNSIINNTKTILI